MFHACFFQQNAIIGYRRKLSMHNLTVDIPINYQRC